MERSCKFCPVKTLWPQGMQFESYCFSLVSVEIDARSILSGFVTYLSGRNFHCPSVNKAITKSPSGYWTGTCSTADIGNFLL